MKEEESAAAMAYRKGLIRKYGGSVQLLCGIHFNFSLPEADPTALVQTMEAEYNRIKENKEWGEVNFMTLFMRDKTPCTLLI